MRLPISLAALLVTISLAVADPINVRTIDRGRSAGWSFVDNGWHTGLDTMRVRFTVDEPIPGTPAFKAGFFDSDGQPLATFDKPPRTEVTSGNYQSLPSNLAAGKTYEVFFAVPPSATDSGSRWKTFVVEISNGGSTALSAYPSSAKAENFELTATKKREGDPSVTAVPVIKRISRFRNGMNAWVGKEWKNGLNTLKVVARIDSGSEAGGFYARAYFYDGSGSKLLEWKKPPQVEVNRGGTYAALPARWSDGEDFEIYFPIPEEIDRGANRWKTAIIVFGNATTAVADAYPSSSIDLKDFQFPERDLVTEPR